MHRKPSMASALPVWRALRCFRAGWKQKGPWAAALKTGREQEENSYPLKSGLSSPQCSLLHTTSWEFPVRKIFQFAACLSLPGGKSKWSAVSSFCWRGFTHFTSKWVYRTFHSISLQVHCLPGLTLQHSPPLNLFFWSEFIGVHFLNARPVFFWPGPDMHHWSDILERELDAQGWSQLPTYTPLAVVLSMRKQLSWPKWSALVSIAHHNEILWFHECQSFKTCRVFWIISLTPNFCYIKWHNGISCNREIPALS